MARFPHSSVALGTFFLAASLIFGLATPLQAEVIYTHNFEADNDSTAKRDIYPSGSGNVVLLLASADGARVTEALQIGSGFITAIEGHIRGREVVDYSLTIDLEEASDEAGLDLDDDGNADTPSTFLSPNEGRASLEFVFGGASNPRVFYRQSWLDAPEFNNGLLDSLHIATGRIDWGAYVDDQFSGDVDAAAGAFQNTRFQFDVKANSGSRLATVVDNISLDAALVPEPASAVLVALGLVGILGRRRSES